MTQSTPPPIEIKALHKAFSSRPGLAQRLIHAASQKKLMNTVHAVNGVDLRIQRGEVLGLVGESGCGKSTLGRMVAGLLPPSEGQIRYRHQNTQQMTNAEHLKYILDVQLIFQDPLASLNPKQKLGQIISEAVYVHRIAPRNEIPQRVEQALLEVGLHLSPTLSFGQRHLPPADPPFENHCSRTPSRLSPA